MSIATELSTLNDNILDAYTAVDGKGGTVPENKNTDNLATAITSIPSGGGATEIPVEAEGPQGEGHITAYDTTTGVISGDGFGSTAGKVWFLNRDTHTYKALSTSSWSDTSITLTTPIDSTSFEGYTSIGVEDADGVWTSKIMVDGSAIQATYGYIYFRNSLGEIEKIEAAADSYATIGGSSPESRVFTISNKTFTSDDVVGVMPNPTNTSFTVTQGTLSFLLNLNQPIKLSSSFTANRILSSCISLNQPVSGTMPSVGDYFMWNCYNFNQSISIQPATYARYFMRGCYNYRQTFTIASNVSSISSYFLAETACEKVIILGTPTISSYFVQHDGNLREINVGNCPAASSSSDTLATSYSNAVSYINGVTVKGTNRSAWLTAFPNSDSSSYRKLIDGNE